jgi:hypothetical protein
MEKIAASNQKQDIDPNKDWLLKPLSTGFVDWGKTLNRDERERRLLTDKEKPNIAKPDLL